jgi:hypothetical protein
MYTCQLFPNFITKQMSHNVPGWRRFASPNKGLRSKTARPNVGEGGVGVSVATDLAD